MSKNCRHRLAVAVVLAGLVVWSMPAAAQYFGRNKVQYRTFKFEVLQTQHFDVYYYPPGRAAAEDAGRRAERWFARLTQVFRHNLSGRQPLVLYLSHADFEQTNITPEEISEGTGGFTDFGRRRIVLPLGASPAETDHVIGHELVHAFQFDVTAALGPQSAAIPGVAGLPLWFVEGLAEYLTIGATDPHTAMWVRDALSDKKLPDLMKLDDPDYFPYRWGQTFWAYVTGRWGDRVIPDLLRAAAAAGDVNRAIEAVLEVDPTVLSKQWQDAIAKAYEPIAASAKDASAYGTPVVKEKSDFGSLNVSPALSPDGKRVAFLSQRDLFSIELYVADTETSKSFRRLTKTAVSPHFTSLGFINAAGEWSPDNRHFAFAAVSGGSPALVIVDTNRGDVAQEIPFKDLGEILSLGYSRDGRSIAFSAQANGFTDLYVYDLPSSKLRKLTDDQFADLQPEWAPDGRTIAFVTDRFSSTLTNLAIGNYRIALIDVTTGATQPLEGMDRGKNTNPQWSPDGRNLFFLSDRTGVTNLYRLDRASGKLFQVTDLYTGISGISSLSPAMSVASESGSVAFSVRENGDYNIYSVVKPEVLEGRAVDEAASAPASAAILPPAVRVPSTVSAMNANPDKGLPAASGFSTKPYKTRLSLQGIAQSGVQVGVDRFGTYAGGGITLYFSDMLGDHNLVTGFQMNTVFQQGFVDTLKNTGVFAGYINRKSRLSWGVIAQQTPYLAGGYTYGETIIDGQYVLYEQSIIGRQVFRDVSGILQFPLNRAQRIEVTGGYRNATYDQVYETVYYDPYYGNALGETKEVVPISSLEYSQVSLALVNDTSSFGPTSPILGGRYRFEVTPTFGGIKFTNVLADYRRYFMPARFYTVAVRGLHTGRYGSDSQDPRLLPFYLGYPDLVRGYDINGFYGAGCSFDPTAPCTEYDSMIGTRILVGNAEFRFPLFRPFTGPNRRMYGPIPLEAVFFADAGIAWNKGEKPKIFGGTRETISSAGVGIRFNALGFLIGEFDVVHPFDRPGENVVFQFNLMAGF